MLELRPVEEKSPLDAKLRAFVSLNPPAEWRETLAEWMRVEQRRFSTEFGKWTSAEKAHITLRFLGTVTQGDVLKVEELLGAIAKVSAPFTLRVDELGCFPRLERARVFWLGLRGGEALQTLQALVCGATMAIGQKPEERAFVPHLTLARMNKPNAVDRKTLRDLVEAQGVPKLPEWRVTEVELTRSALGKGGSTYTPLAAFKLGG